MKVLFFLAASMVFSSSIDAMFAPRGFNFYAIVFAKMNTVAPNASAYATLAKMNPEIKKPKIVGDRIEPLSPSQREYQQRLALKHEHQLIAIKCAERDSKCDGSCASFKSCALALEVDRMMEPNLRSLKEGYDYVRHKRHKAEQIAISCAKNNFECDFRCVQSFCPPLGCKDSVAELRGAENIAREKLKAYTTVYAGERKLEYEKKSKIK